MDSKTFICEWRLLNQRSVERKIVIAQDMATALFNFMNDPFIIQLSITDVSSTPMAEVEEALNYVPKYSV